jgi:hypothetical protein
MNANNYFNNQTGTPRPFDNANHGPLRWEGLFAKIRHSSSSTRRA